MTDPKPLGPLHKREIDEITRQDIAHKEATHQARQNTASTAPRIRKSFVLIILFLLVIAGIAGGIVYKRFDEKMALKDAELAVGLKPPQVLRLDMDEVASYLDGSPTVLYIHSLSSEEAQLLRKQAELFRDLALSPADQPDALASLIGEAQANFPQEVYFTRPRAGKFELGSREQLEAKVGSSNVFPMSMMLRDSFLDTIKNAQPRQFSASLKNMRSKALKEIEARKNAAPQDDQNKAQDAADLQWLKNLLTYTDRLISQAERLESRSTGRSALALQWQKLQKEEAPLLVAAVDPKIADQAPGETQDLLVISDNYDLMIEVNVRGQRVFLAPDAPREWFFRDVDLH